MILLGTVERIDLKNMLDEHLSKERTAADLAKKAEIPPAPSPTCPTHDQQQQQCFRVMAIPENEALNVTSVENKFYIL